MSIEFIVRLIRDQSKIEVCEKESQLLQNVTNFQARQYLIKRKTIIIFLICVYCTSLLTELVNLAEFSYPDEHIERKFQIVFAFNHIIHYGMLSILAYQLYYWNDYRRSSAASLVSVCYLLIGQPILLWVPYFELLGGQLNITNTIIMVSMISGLIINCLQSIYLFRQINVGIVKLLTKFSIPEFHVMDAILTIITVPFITYTLVIIFQIIREPIIPFVWIWLLLTAYVKYVPSNMARVYSGIYYCVTLSILIYMIVTQSTLVVMKLNKLIHDIPNIIVSITSTIMNLLTQFKIVDLIIEDMLIYALNYLKKQQTGRTYSEFLYELNGTDLERLIQL